MLMLQFGPHEMGWWGEGVEGNGLGPSYEVKECFIHHPLLFLTMLIIQIRIKILSDTYNFCQIRIRVQSLPIPIQISDWIRPV
jgi:hypothetical protein